MKTTLALLAGFGLSLSSAYACDFQRSAQTNQSTVDTTTVASVSDAQSQPVIIPDTQSQGDQATAD